MKRISFERLSYICLAFIVFFALVASSFVATAAPGLPPAPTVTTTNAEQPRGVPPVKRLLPIGGMAMFRVPSTLYMATDGVDTGSCTNIASPCLTYDYAADLLIPGDTLAIRGGTYPYNFDNGGSECSGCVDGTDMTIGSGAIYVRAYSNETVVVREFHHSRNYWIVKGINIDGIDVFTDGLSFTASHQYFGGFDDAHRVYVTRSVANGCGSSHDGGEDNHLQYFRIYDNGNRDPAIHNPHHGCYWSAPNGIIEDGEFDHNQDVNGYGIQLFNNTTLIHPSGIVMRRLSIHDNSRGLTTASQGDGNQIYNCLIYANAISGVDIQTGTGTLFANNTIYGGGGVGIQMVGSTNALIKNNIVYGDAGADIIDYSGSGTTYLDNMTGGGIIDANTSVALIAGVRGNTQTGNVTGDPGFIAPSSTPPNLTVANNTPPVSTGVNLSVAFTTDFAGNNRPPGSTAWTLGAYEYNAGTCTPSKLLVTSQPISAITGATLGTVSIGVYNSSNVLCPSATNSITIAKHGSATWNALGATSGTLTKSAVGGVATWVVLYVSSTTGSGKITATASGLTSVDTDSITITAAPSDPCGSQPPPCTFFASYTHGNDSWSGLDIYHPWKHMPNMNGSTGNPAYYNGQTTLPGYKFIFQGGDTWPRTVFQTASDGGWIIGTSGTGYGANAVYWGVDPTFYTGSAWSRPIFNLGGSSAGTMCNPQNYAISFAPENYDIIDNIEFTGLYWDATCDGTLAHQKFGYIAMFGNDGHHELKNLYMHGWAHDTVANGTIDHLCVLYGGDSTGVDQTTTFHDNVIEDETHPAQGAASCRGIGGGAISYNNYLAYLSNGYDAGGNIFYQNTCNHVGGNFYGEHDQCFEDNGSHFDTYIFNNLVMNSEAGQGIFSGPAPGYTAWVFNNVFTNSAFAGGVLICDDTFHVSMYGTCKYINNTVYTESSGLGSGCSDVLATGCDYTNNHFISPSGASIFDNCVLPVCTKSHNLGQTPAAALTDGYDPNGTPPLFPVSGGDTIGNGTSIASICAINAYLANLCTTTTAGVRLNAVNHTVIAPNLTDAVTRSATPDIGAYQFNSTAPIIVSVSPNTATQGDGPVIVTVTTLGIVLDADSFPDIENTGDATIPGWTFIDSSHVSFPLYLTTGATLGPRDITVTVGGTTLTLVDGLTVTALGSVHTTGGGNHSKLKAR